MIQRPSKKVEHLELRSLNALLKAVAEALAFEQAPNVLGWSRDVGDRPLFDTHLLPVGGLEHDFYFSIYWE